MQVTRRTMTAWSLALLAGASHAQAAYPSKTIRFIVPFPPGGGTDILTRLVAQKLTETLKWTVVVDNKPGAGGNLALDTTAKATPDGYTIVMAQTDNEVLNPLLYSKLSYDPIKDLRPVAALASGAAVLVVKADSPYKTLQDVIAAAKANPGKPTFATPGIGTVSHVLMELWDRAAGIQLTHVPYKGIANAMPDLLGGQIDMYMGSIPTLQPHIQAGKVRALAVSSEKRSLVLPDVPTYVELGMKSVVLASIWGVMAPAGTPDAIVQQLSVELNKVLQMPDAREKILASGAELLGGTPKQMGDLYASERARLAPVIREAKISLE